MNSNNSNNNCIGNAFKQAMKEIEIKCAEEKAKKDAEIKAKQLTNKLILEKKTIFDSQMVKHRLYKTELGEKLISLKKQYNNEFSFRVYDWRDNEDRLMLDQFAIYFISLKHDRIPIRLVCVINLKDFSDLFELFKRKNLIWFINAFGEHAVEKGVYPLLTIKKIMFRHPFDFSSTTNTNTYKFCPKTSELLKKCEFDDNFKLIYIKSSLKHFDEHIEPFVLPLPKKEETKKEEPSQKIKGLKTKEFGR